MRHLLAATKAFADPTRVRVVFALRTEELCVCELCDALGVVQSTLSTHLQYLRQAGLVRTRNDGKWVYYRLTDDFARMASALFQLHQPELEADPQLRTDTARLKKRLALRQEDACCFGFSTKRVASRSRKGANV
jgi:ArsR family transcriptional regulator, arsenate/arsenite/antimonite-responsive transcriptional repressor